MNEESVGTIMAYFKEVKDQRQGALPGQSQHMLSYQMQQQQ